MTDEYVLDVILEMKLKWNIDLDTGYYIADAHDGVRLYLKGCDVSSITLTFVRQGLKYKITEPPCPLWRKGKDVPPVKQRLKALLEQARKQNTHENIDKRSKEIKEELLSAAIGWNAHS